MKDASGKRNPGGNTWTIRPDKDVKAAVGEFLKNNSGYDRTKIINEALRLRLPDAVKSLLLQEMARMEAQLAELNRPKKKLSSLKNAKQEFLGRVRDRAAELAPNKPQ